MLLEGMSGEVFPNSISVRNHFCVQRTFMISRDLQIDELKLFISIFFLFYVAQNFWKFSEDKSRKCCHFNVTHGKSFVMNKLKISSFSISASVELKMLHSKMLLSVSLRFFLPRSRIQKHSHNCR